MLSEENNNIGYLLGRLTLRVELAVGTETLPPSFVSKFMQSPRLLTCWAEKALRRSPDDTVLQELADRVGEIPASLSNADQGRFYVGYYHQRHADNRLVMAREIVRLRRQRGLTQEQLAELSGIKQNNLSRIEQGRYNITLDTLSRLFAAMDVKVTYE
jgi:DNA-binding XRE family transcriptional regulator